MSYPQQIANFVAQAFGQQSPYQSNYLAVHSAALENIFPATAEVLKEHFPALAQAYCQHFPADNWDINFYGDRFPAFVAAQQQGRRGEAAPWLAISWLTEFEYLVSLAYYAEEGQVFTIEAPTLSLNPQWDALINAQHPYLQLTWGLAHTTCIQRQGNKVVADAQ